MIRESLYFTYDGISSKDMGIVQINTDSGLLEEVFLPNKTIVEEKIRGRDKPYFYDVEREPITIPLTLWFQEGLSEENVRKATRWLDQDFYKELYFSENPTRRFYAMYEGSSSLLHNSIKEGYVNISMRCDSPYSYSPVYTSDVYDLSNNPTSTEIIFENEGDLNCQPILYIEKIGAGDISIVNKSDGGRMFKMTGLTNLELITVDNEYEDIETDIIGVQRYDNHNDIYLDFPRGKNYLEVTGNCKLKFKYQFRTIQG